MHRLENENLADEVLKELTEVLRSFPFDFQGARIISGKEEGAYGWITINYLLGKFTKVSGSLGANAIAISGSTWIVCQNK